jgi:subtilisin family serine protease
MRKDEIVRRFELHASDAASLSAALDELRRKVAKQPKDQVRFPAGPPSDQSDSVIVTLAGQPSATTAVRDDVARMPNVRIYHDWIDAPVAVPDAPVAVTARGVAVHKDPIDRRALLRIDPEGRSKREMGSGTRVVVAIVDSGLMVDHPRFRGHLWTRKIDGRDVHGACVVDGAPAHDLTDQDGHGTMLAGTILATANEVDGLELMAVKFFDVLNQPAAATAARAIRFATDNQASIINLSFDLGIGSRELRDAIGAACQAGALVVIAAGNTGGDNDRYPLVPACYAQEFPDNVIVVMATDEYDGKPTFTNFGSATVDLAAPGVKIASTRRFVGDGDPREYGRYTGTSAAAAQVTGAAALLRSRWPNSKATDLKHRLLETVDVLPGLKCRSGGRLNLGRALSTVLRKR